MRRGRGDPNVVLGGAPHTLPPRCLRSQHRTGGVLSRAQLLPLPARLLNASQPARGRRKHLRARGEDNACFPECCASFSKLALRFSDCQIMINEDRVPLCPSTRALPCFCTAKHACSGAGTAGSCPRDCSPLPAQAAPGTYHQLPALKGMYVGPEVVRNYQTWVY